ncbi:hypothetical protein MUK42_07397 [Musa troglodytarum]|nr:hypothetical protein MUK42_07397 [Musa troglodytarum]URD78273.1 hypothetical protein MUK42_07397 [Musa troglodytarum]
MFWTRGDGNNGSEGEETMDAVWIEKFKLCPNRLHSRKRGENLEVHLEWWHFCHSLIIKSETDGILLLDVNIILGAGDYCAWAAPPVYTRGEPTEGVGRSFVTDRGNRKPSRRRRECKGETLMSPYKFATFIVSNAGVFALHHQPSQSGAATGSSR